MAVDKTLSGKEGRSVKFSAWKGWSIRLQSQNSSSKSESIALIGTVFQSAHTHKHMINLTMKIKTA